MSTIIASHIPKTVTSAKLSEFFSFCGKIKTINPIPSTDEKFQSIEVIFASDKAVHTALLLNDAELDGVPIQVTTAPRSGLPLYSSVAAGGASTAVAGDNKAQGDDVTHTGDNDYDDVSQEEKPKYAIMAQLLASGYVVSDQLIDKAIETDKEKGYSSKFKSFLDGLDSKYIHSKEPRSTANKTVEQASSKLSEWTDAFNKSSYKHTLDHYYDQAANHPYGKKVAEFYRTLAKDALAVHTEAKRLADLKKKPAEDEVERRASFAEAGAAINSVN